MDEKKAKPKTGKPEANELTGRVESITAGGQFLFEVAGKKSGRRSFSVPPDDKSIIGLVTAAYMAGKKVTVVGSGQGEPVETAREVHVGSKRKPPKALAKPYPKKLKPAEPMPPVTPVA